MSYEISLFLKWNENLKTEAKKPFIGLAVAVAENMRDSADLSENMVKKTQQNCHDFRIEKKFRFGIHLAVKILYSGTLC